MQFCCQEGKEGEGVELASLTPSDVALIEDVIVHKAGSVDHLCDLCETLLLRCQGTVYQQATGERSKTTTLDRHTVIQPTGPRTFPSTLHP